jgi:Protein of unknown function (DUF3084)
MSISTVLLIVFLVILSGIIAYVGDWLGSYVGRKRLSLFGARPKQTGRIIGIGAGIAIMVITLGVAALTFRNAWRTIISAIPVQEKVRELELQERSLNSSIQKLDVQISELQTQNKTITDTNNTLLKKNEDLNTANETLNLNVQTKTAEVTNLEKQLEVLNTTLNDQAKKLESVSQALDARGELTYRLGELIATTVISSQDRNDIASDLVNFIRDANNSTAQRGAGEVTLSSDQYTSLLEDATATPGPDVIILRSDNNQFGLAQVSFIVESFENEKVFSAGQLLVSLPIVLPEQTQIRNIRTEVTTLWAMARTKLYNLGVVDNIAPESDLESSSSEGFTNELLRIAGSGRITIGLIVHQDIYISGPATLELTVINN